jgi:membrane complex biogenesis BtpA family protein
MTLREWEERFGVATPVIGMLHAPPLPGSPRYAGDWPRAQQAVLDDAVALVEGGAQGLLLENFGDAPFFPRRVPAITIACLAALAQQLRQRFAVPLGINVLRNDGRSALAVAIACQAQFIRVNVLCGARLTDQGVVHGIAHRLLRDRAAVGAQQIGILADVNVKHSAPLADRPLGEEVSELLQRGGADALVVTGSATGEAVNLNELRCVKELAEEVPVLLGSGVTPDNVRTFLPYADGFIVGTGVKHDAVVDHRVDAARVARLVAAVQQRRRPVA